MKYRSILFFIIGLIFLTYTQVFAQEVPANLAGDWVAKCIPEKTKINEMQMCGICHTSVSDNGESLEVRDFEVNFTNSEMIARFEEGNETVPFKYNQQTQNITFILEGKSYDFSVLYVDVLSKVIWKSVDGTIVYLERKNQMRKN